MTIRSRLTSLFSTAPVTRSVEALMTSMLGGGPTRITSAHDGLRISTVYACIDTISKTVASLPIKVLHVTTDGDKVMDSRHPLHRLLTVSPQAHTTIYTWKRDLMMYYLAWGNAYALILRDPNMNILSLPILRPYDVWPWRDGDNRLWYKVYHPEHQGTYSPEDIIHLRDMGDDDLGYSKIHLHAITLGKEKAANDFINKFYKNGMFLGAVIEYDKGLTDEQIQQMRTYFKTAYGGIDKSGEAAIISNGGKLKQLKSDMPLSDAQYIQSSGMNKKEICSIYSVPPPKIGFAEGTPYNSLESMNTDYWQNCILPIVTMLEQEIVLKCFAASESRTIKHNYDSILMADTKSQGEYYRTMFNIGVMNRNEIREAKDLNRIDGGDVYYIMGNNMVPAHLIDTTGNAIQENT